MYFNLLRDIKFHVIENVTCYDFDSFKKQNEADFEKHPDAVNFQNKLSTNLHVQYRCKTYEVKLKGLL